MVVVRTMRTGPNGAKEPVARNTGFFVSKDGEVVTSLYVWVQGGSLQVVAHGGRRSEARMKGVDQHTGLALLETELEETPHLQTAPSEPEPGDWVVAAVARSERNGGINVLYNPGKLSGTNESRRLCGVKWDNLFTLDVPVVRGGAAAPVLDHRGRLAGVILAAERDEKEGRQALAIGPKSFDSCLDIMRKGGRRTGWLGVVLTCKKENPGARIEAVLPGSPADSAGLRRGDVLVSVNEREVTCAAVLENTVVRAKPGTTVDVSVRRDGEQKELKVKIGPRPLQIPE